MKKVTSVLSSPEAMAQVRGMLDALSGAPASAAPSAQTAPQQESGVGDAALLQGLQGLLSSGAAAPAGAAAGQDPRTALLQALRPFLSDKRASKLDTALRLLQLGSLTPLLKNMLD